MDRKGYFMSLRNPKRYNPYENDEMMLNNENKMNNLIDKNIHNNMIDKRKTPLVLTPKIILDNSNYSNNNITKISKSNYVNSENENINNIKKYPSESLIFRQKTDINKKKNNNSINEKLLKEEYINMDEDEEDIYLPTIHWKYDGPTGLNTEKKHFPKKKNIGYFFKTPIPKKKSESVKSNSLKYINNNYELNSDFDNINNNIYNNYSNLNNEKNNAYYYRTDNNNNYNEQSNNNNNNNQNRSRSNDTKKMPYLYDNPNQRYNLYRSEEKPESMINKYNKDRINKMIYSANINNSEIDNDDMDDYNGNKRYKYYNPNRFDYKGSRYGDYSYNYYLNAPMRGDKSQSWKFPPLYYYNSDKYN